MPRVPCEALQRLVQLFEGAPKLIDARAHLPLHGTVAALRERSEPPPQTVSLHLLVQPKELELLARHFLPSLGPLAAARWKAAYRQRGLPLYGGIHRAQQGEEIARHARAVRRHLAVVVLQPLYECVGLSHVRSVLAPILSPQHARAAAEAADLGRIAERRLPRSERGEGRGGGRGAAARADPPHERGVVLCRERNGGRRQAQDEAVGDIVARRVAPLLRRNGL